MKNKLKSFFKSHPKHSIKRKDIAKKVGAVTLEEYSRLKEVLYKLEMEGFIEKQGKRYKLLSEKQGNKTGIIDINESGNFAFVDTGTGQDIFIPEKYLNTALNGDKVEISLLAKKRGKNIEGAVKKVLERKNDEVIGILKLSRSFYFVKPDDPKIHRDIYINPDNLSNAQQGDKVIISDLFWEDPHLNPEGNIIEILGKAGSYDTEIAAIAKEFGLSRKFGPKVEKELDNLSDAISDEEISKRLDLREKMIFTIDPDDAKDYDDAVSIEKLENGNYEIGVHIADVTHYVTPGSPIYKEALYRGTSVYLVGKVIPMLPEKLSNVICSLVADKDRLTYSVIVELSPTGKLVKYNIAKSVINSKKRFTYKEAQQILNNGKGQYFDQLFQLNKLAKTLRSKRLKTGSINFIRPEVEFKLDDEGKPIKLIVKSVQDTNQLIEEFMLLANKIVATHIHENTGTPPFPFVYRIHDKPDEAKLQELSVFLKTFGYNFNPYKSNINKQLQKVLELASGSNEDALLNEVAIRSMAKAEYSTENIGHFGLAFDNYSHFTSPIRRFPDLIIHYLLHNYLNGKTNVIKQNALEEICESCSLAERNAISAERYSVKLKQIEYLQNKIGHEFDGVISGITNFGIFAQLSDSLAEGLIKLNDLDDDFYLLDEKNYTLRGRDTGKTFRLGDKIKVKIIRVDLDRKEIDFVLLNN